MEKIEYAMGNNSPLEDIILKLKKKDHNSCNIQIKMLLPYDQLHNLVLSDQSYHVSAKSISTVVSNKCEKQTHAPMGTSTNYFGLY